jgi:hypothetical protein
VNRARIALVPLLALSGAFIARPAFAETDDECITWNENAVQLRKANKLLESRENLARCSAPACPDVVRSSCADRLSQLNAVMPSVVFEVHDANGKDTTNVKLYLDDRAIARSLEGQAFEVDPGAHSFRFELPDGATLTRELVIREGEKSRHEVVSFEPEKPPAPPPVEQPPPAPPTPLGVWILGGVGAASVVAGTVSGVMAIVKWNNAQHECNSTSCTSLSQANTDHDGAQTAATVSTVTFIAGGALVAGAAVWYFLPRYQRSTVTAFGIDAAPGRAAVSFGGRF